MNLLQHADAGFLVDAEAAALGGDALACAMHELTARGRRLAERLRDVVVVAIEDVVQHERSALLFAEPLEQRHEGDRQVAREFRVRLGRHDLDFRERLGQPRTEVRGPLRLRRAQPIDREPRDHGCQPRLGGAQLRRVLLVPAQPRILQNILRIRAAAEHPIGDAEQPVAMAGEDLDVCGHTRAHGYAQSWKIQT